MNTFVQGFLDNDSFFGKFMTKAGIIIGANLMFILCCIPGVTIGAGFVALHHVMLKTLRGDGVLNPFKEYWIGFKDNFKQATLCWLAFVALLFFGYWDLSICSQAGGGIGLFTYGIYAIGFVCIVLYCMLLPTMAAFADSIPHLLRNAWYLALKKPFKTIVIVFFDVFPLILTYSDLKDLPLYAFLWTMFGFGAIAMLSSTLLLPEIKPFLEEKETDFACDPMSDEEEMLDELRMLDGF